MPEAEPTTKPHTRKNSPDKPHTPRQTGTVLHQPAFDWKLLDSYVKLLNFEMEVSNILQTRLYALNDEEKVPIIKPG